MRFGILAVYRWPLGRCGFPLSCWPGRRTTDGSSPKKWQLAVRKAGDHSKKLPGWCRIIASCREVAPGSAGVAEKAFDLLSRDQDVPESARWADKPAQDETANALFTDAKHCCSFLERVCEPLRREPWFMCRVAIHIRSALSRITCFNYPVGHWPPNRTDCVSFRWTGERWFEQRAQHLCSQATPEYRDHDTVTADATVRSTE
jgi:hypothetical protein